MNWISETQLKGLHVTLEALSMLHLTELQLAVADGELWKLWFTSVPKPEQIEDYIKASQQLEQQQLAYTFVVIDNATGKAIGSTRYCNIDPIHKRLEIGYTWYAKSYQRTAVNTETKLLLLRHAFETLETIAVEFRTNWHNQASRNAIARLGAKQDGILRQHQKMEDGAYRDTVVFSILNSEWLAVKKNLVRKLESY